MERAPRNSGSYIRTLTKQQLIDYYTEQMNFWRSVIKKYPTQRNRSQLSRMDALRTKEMQKE